MNPALIGADATFGLFIFAAIAANRAAFQQTLAKAHLGDSNKATDSGVELEHVLRARRAELIESRWDLVGVLFIFGLVIAGVWTIVYALSH